MNIGTRDYYKIIKLKMSRKNNVIYVYKQSCNVAHSTRICYDYINKTLVLEFLSKNNVIIRIPTCNKAWQ